MNFEHSDKVKQLLDNLNMFMDNYIYPIEKDIQDFIEDPANLWQLPPMFEDLKVKARSAGLWNLFLPKDYGELGAGLTNLEYAPMAEIMGRSKMASEVFNCSAPDTGNMEVLARYGTKEQQEQWLIPLLAGEIRSAFLMTEPQNACSDATNVSCSIRLEGNEYVINGRKWWSSGAYHPNCELFILMGKTDPEASRHIQQSMILVPKSATGVELVRPLQVFGSLDSPEGHAEIALNNVRVPASNILVGEGKGFEIAQGRLGPGRIHHCMRLIGAAQRSLEIMCDRVNSRVAFGRSIGEQGSIRENIARSRCEIEQARLLTLSAADQLDKYGNKVAKDLIAMIKIVAPQMCQNVVDRAIQAHGGMGVCQDTPLPSYFAYARMVRIADGPDEVHMNQLGKTTINQYTLT